MFVGFSLKFYFPPWFGKTIKFMVFRLLENPFASQNIESIHFYSNLPIHFYSNPPLSHKFKSPPSRLKLLISASGNIFSKICFPQQQKEFRREETVICFIKIPSENIKMN